MDINNVEFSYFRFIWDINNPKVMTIEEFLSHIRNPDALVKNIVKRIREATTKQDKDALKKKLPCVTPAGLFTTKCDSAISHMSGLICIDLDHVKDLKVERKRLESYPYILSVFMSPSGDGLKVLIKHDISNPTHFKALYLQLGCDIGVVGRADLDFDTSCSNISHACFFSYDPEFYLNEQAKVYHFEPPMIPPHNSSALLGIKGKENTVGVTQNPGVLLSDPAEIEKAILDEHEWFERYNTFYEGNRNNKLFILAKFFKEAGIPENDVTDYLVAYYANPQEGFPANEIVNTIHSAYANN